MSIDNTGNQSVPLSSEVATAIRIHRERVEHLVAAVRQVEGRVGL